MPGRGGVLLMLCLVPVWFNLMCFLFVCGLLLLFGWRVVYDLLLLLFCFCFKLFVGQSQCNYYVGARPFPTAARAPQTR